MSSYTRPYLLFLTCCCLLLGIGSRLVAVEIVPGTLIPLRKGTGNAFTMVPTRKAPPAMRASLTSLATIDVEYIGFTPEARAAFQAAVDIWKSNLTSPVPIKVKATWKALDPGMLGAAGAKNYVSDFPNAPKTATLYPIALANAIAGSDQDPADYDIEAMFNSAEADWYLGLDGKPPANKYDFLTVVLHELGHGLGFAGSARVALTLGVWGDDGTPFVYDPFVKNGDGHQIVDTTRYPNPSIQLKAQLLSDNLYFDGTHARTAAGGRAPKLFAPADWRQGSSYSHLDDDEYPAANPNSLMTPYLDSAEAIHDPGPITIGIFRDMGWPDVTDPGMYTVKVPEGGTATVSIRLLDPISTPVTLTVTRTSGDPDLTITSGGTLTFTPDNYQVPQLITVAAAEDDDIINGSAIFTSTGNGATTSSFTATEEDNDKSTPAVTLVVDPTVVSVPEGATASFTVRLSAQPAADVTVTVARGATGDADLTVQSGNSLTFTTANWQTAQRVTLAAADDADTTNGTAPFACTATGMPAVTVTATEVDNDGTTPVTLVIDPMDVYVPEGATATFTVRLSAQPTAALVVTVARGATGDADLTVQSGASLTFTPTTWQAAQTVTLAAADDADTLDGTALFSCTATGVTAVAVTATEVDDDSNTPVELIVEPRDVLVPEGATGTFTIRLSAQPAAPVVVSVVRTVGDADLSVQSGASLTFTPVNWQTAQTVTLAAAEDGDVISGLATFTCTAISMTAVTVTVTESDNDGGATVTLVVVPTTLSVLEEGTGTFSVRLSAAPTAPLTVTVARMSGDTDLTVQSGANLTFTPVNWQMPQVVTLAAADDADTVNGTATFACTAPGVTMVAVSVTEIDNDVKLIAVMPADLRVEEGQTGIVTVRLSKKPDAEVTVAVARSAGDTDITVQAGASLIFTTQNWNSPQQVRVAAAEDADTVDGTATIRCTSDTWAAGVVTVTEDDNDRILGALLVTPVNLSIGEGRTDGFTVSLSVKPLANVTVTCARSAGDPELAIVSGATLLFTPTNWNVPQVVTVMAAEDSDRANESATFSCAALRWTGATVTAQALDNDTLWIQADRHSVAVPEGESATVGVRLSAPPIAPVQVTLGCSGDADLTASPRTLTFTAVTWATPQLVTLSAAKDPDMAAGGAVLTCSAAGWVSAVVVLTEVDTDSPVIEVSTDNVTVPEGGTATVSIRLRVQPLEPVVVNVQNIDGDADLQVVAGAQLTFTATNWEQEQVVTVSAASDGDAVNGSASIACWATGWTSAVFTAREVDDDTPRILVDPGALIIPEGTTSTVRVRLNSAPSTSVTVTVKSVAGDPDLTVTSGTSLLFTTDNWHIAQPVALMAKEDADGGNGSATIQCKADSTWMAADLLVTEADNDPLIILVTPSTLKIPEKTIRTISVTLKTQPMGTEIVTAAFISGDPDLTVVSGGSLTFTPANYLIPQLVSIRAVDDLDNLRGTARLRCSAPGWTSAEVVVTEIDVDPLVLDGFALTTDLGSPQPLGSAVTLTAVATSNSPLLYKFRVATRSGTTLIWTTLRDYATEPTVLWLPMKAADYVLACYTREVDSTVAYRDYRTITYQITASTLAKVTLTASPASPQPVQSVIALTATPSGGLRHEYRFRVGMRSGTAIIWSTVQDYSSSAHYTWAPTQAGSYVLAVYARQQGMTVAYQVYATIGYTITLPPLTGLAVQLTPATGGRVGTPIQVTALPSAGTAPTYRFRIAQLTSGTPGSWQVLREYSAVAHCPWTPTAAGEWQVAVDARDGVAQFTAVRAYRVLPSPLTAVALTLSPVATQPVHTLISLTATPQGGDLVQYRFQVGIASGGETLWTTFRDYSEQAWATWSSPRAETVTFLVEAREGATAPPVTATGAMTFTGVSIVARTNAPDSARMVWVPAGGFVRGTGPADLASLQARFPGQQPSAYAPEQPQQVITVSGYWIYAYEVTVAQYRAFCVATKRLFPQQAPRWGWRDEHPMVNITWADAQAYAAWVGGRLPTEAEWEKAARWVDGRHYPWGNDWNATLCNSWQDTHDAGGGYGAYQTAPVGRYANDISLYGVYDLAGNVMEWCQDWYDADYYAEAPATDPQGPLTSAYRSPVVRGGNWYASSGMAFRTAYRNDVILADTVSDSIGFRVVVPGP
jgi:formylglycine-generating enzyme required for sulfatase activity